MFKMLQAISTQRRTQPSSGTCHRWTGRLVVTALALFPGGWASGSDFSHVCRTADGIYELNDGQLYRVDNTANNIPYESLGETVLKSETGYCTSRKAPGQKFGYESKSYVLQLRFIDQGQTITTSAVCELASSGLPAMYNCDRSVVTSRTGGGQDGSPGQGSGASLWNHNGSTMRLEARGQQRNFIYQRPRDGMRKAGARAGTVLFEGRREGDTYIGTAYIFSRRCGPQPYAVSGPVAADERTVTLYGQAPVMSRDCRVERYRADRLDFDLIRN